MSRSEIADKKRGKPNNTPRSAGPQSARGLVKAAGAAAAPSIQKLPAAPPGSAEDLARIVRLILGPEPPPDQKTRTEIETRLGERARDLAEDALAELRNRAASPPVTDEVDRLREVSELARNLRGKLAVLSNTTRILMEDDLRDQQRPVRLDKRSTPAPSPSAVLGAELLGWPADRGASPLEALARSADYVRKEIERRAASPSGGGMKRSRENVHAHFVGDVRLHVAFEAGKLLGQFQGLRAVTGTEGGPLYTLVAAVWRYMAGGDAEEAAWAHAVKRAAPAARMFLEAFDASRAESDNRAAGERLLRAEAEARRRLFGRPALP
jgi:hypothetical protein